MNSLFKGNFNIVDTVDYLIDIEYGQKDWTMVSALREVISNMLDTKANYIYTYNNGIGTIEDEGTGLPRKAFVLGSSSKSNDNTSIGQYGEGLKMSLITCLRNNRKISIQTIGYGVEAKSVFSEKYKTNVMSLEFNDNTRKVGTCIKIECTEEEWNAAIDLFLQLKEGFQKLDDNLYLPGGFVSILGLKTEEKSGMLFSYDLNDKSITNRDRNVVKSKKLKDNMQKILNNLKTQKAIRMYLNNLIERPEAEEYKILLNPKKVDMWQKTIEKLFGNKAVYSTTIENDIKATAQGYKVIACPNKDIRKTFANIGLESSKEVSKGIKNNSVSLVEKDKITYPISKNYIENWTYLDAGREILANASDAARTKTTIKYENGQCIVEDDGEGIQKKNFVIGNSQKTDEQIGTFGEGIKMAALVMARDDRDMYIETVGYTYKPILEDSKEFGTEVFSIKYKKNKRKKGTRIIFNATEEETNNIRNLFIMFREDIIKKDYGKIEVITNEHSNIYVNGLKSASLETIYSYNIKEKSLVNTRDRNHIDDSKLSVVLSDLYNKTTDKELISDFITNWRDNPYSYEYKLVIIPENLDLWKEVCSTVLNKCCIASSYDMESNFIAKQAGYELLVNIPSYVKEILGECLESSSFVASKYGKKGILLGNRIVYPITDNYIDSWEDLNAIKELISNGIDTKTEVTVDYLGGKRAVIEDRGEGFQKKDLLIGTSSKSKDGEAIGVFGEGLKMACLVLAKDNRVVEIETVGFTVNAHLEKDEEFDSNVLVLEFRKNDRTVGTKITFETAKANIEKAKRQFLYFNPKYKPLDENIPTILTPGGKLYINGVEIQDIHSIYSYNFTGEYGKSILNRDRTNAYEDRLNRMVTETIGKTSDENIIKSILKCKTSAIEMELGNYYYDIEGKWKRKWKKVAMSVFENSCLPNSNSEINLVAKDKGYKVLINISSSLSNILNYINFPHARDVVKLRGDEDIARRVIEESQLTEKEKIKWNLIKQVIIDSMGENYLNHINICEEFVNPDGGETHGLHSPANNQCYVLRKLLSDKYSIGYMLGVIRHEFVHMDTGSYDRTREFENHLTNLIGEYMEKLYLGNI